jgi:uncharacterized damage-inducible protein DinB
MELSRDIAGRMCIEWNPFPGKRRINMSIGQSLVGEFEHEAATTRKCLEHIPQDKFGWKPHEKSMTVGELGGHIADMTGWATVTMTMDVFDMHPKDGPAWESPKPQTVAALLNYYDKGVAEAKKQILAADDAKYMANWSLANGGNILMTMPRAAVMRSFVMNHIVHHRGQLSVYLRQLDVKVPSIYGPSADEGQMG